MSPAATCPACAAPVSPRAVTCALCDHVIHPSRLAAAARAADRRPSSAMPAFGGVRRGAKRVLVVLGVLALLAGVATVALVHSLVRQANDIAAERAAEQAKTVARLRVAWPAVDAAAHRVTLAVKAGTVPDRQALREFVAAVAPPRTNPEQSAWLAAMDVDTAAWTRYGQPRLAALPSGDRPGRIVKTSLPARLPDTLRLQLAADTLSPWVGVLRRAAASPLPPAAWSFRRDVPGVAGPMVAPQLGFGVFKSLVWGNGAAALLALDAGDRVGAVRHARENVAASHLLARTPSTMAWLLGRNQLRTSAELLAHVGRHARDSSAVADASVLLRALDEMKGLRYAFGPTPDARDAAARATLAIVRDTMLPPALRAETAVQVVTGSCLSTREMLTGAAATRQAALDAAIAGLADLDPEQRLRPMVARSLVEWNDVTDNGAEMREGWTQRPTWAAALASVGLGGIAGRTVACTLL